MMATRQPPIVIPPSSPPRDQSKSAAFVFIHGLGDDAAGVEPIARQFQAAGKLPYMSWVLPNAPFNHDLLSTAWYMPTRLPRFPVSRPELEDEEDGEGMKANRKYIISLLDELVAQGIPKGRIVLGGFSQGHAMALFTGLTSTRYAGKLAGLVGLSGYLPLPDRIPEMREEAGLPLNVEDEVSIFIARGVRDMLVPKRYLTMCSDKLAEYGVKPKNIHIKEYEGLAHAISGGELRDLCQWLERTIPPLD